MVLLSLLYSQQERMLYLMNIDISGLRMTYPTGKTALQDIQITLTSPSLIGLLGPNGAGKSTLMKLLTAALVPTKGTITIDGQPLGKVERQFKAQLGYLPQSFGLYEELTVYQFLDYMAALKGIKESRAAIDQVMLHTNLTDKRRAKIRTLSGGQRQRVGIAQALLGEPSLLILDEPTVGLDPEERVHFRDLFSQIAQNKLVLLSTHIIEDVQSVCDQLIVIDHGQILFTGTPEALTAMARGHVGIFAGDLTRAEGCEITSRVNTAQGVICRGVADVLPDAAQPVEPTLEDAYMYLMMKEASRP